MPYQRWIKGFVSVKPDRGARGLEDKQIKKQDC
jgi:hypothetical protein